MFNFGMRLAALILLAIALALPANPAQAEISGKIKFGIRKGKDIGDTKRILIDAVSDMKMAIAKRAVQEVKKRKKDYPALRRELEAQVPGAR